MITSEIERKKLHFMNQNDLIKALKSEIIKTTGDSISNILGIDFDSRKIKTDYIFTAIKGFSSDGHRFIKKAVEQGANTVIYENEIENLNPNVLYIKVKDSRKALASAAKIFYNNPSENIALTGITGTNGKTSTVHILNHIFSASGFSTASAGTLGIFINDDKIASELTTPDIITLNQILNESIKSKVSHMFMEVSSHSVILHRIFGLKFKHKIFSNLSPDHLDFHKNMEDYKNAKFKFFEPEYGNSINIINIDDKIGEKLYQSLQKKNRKTISYGSEKTANYQLKDLEIHNNVCSFVLNTMKFTIPIPGYFYIINSVPAIITALEEGLSYQQIYDSLKTLQTIPGRYQTLKLNNNNLCIIDFAHTPDSLQKLLIHADKNPHNRIVTVFGCGGDRDKQKRPVMGKIAEELSDFVIITNDNPRTENSDNIINDIKQGFSGHEYKIVKNRREAISQGLNFLTKNDILIIAGKGHEEYQIIGKEKIYFSDLKTVKEIVNKKQNSE